ncbi:MAG: EAL domain-containing protein [Methylophaga sp.]|nr:EAL domain-containing protein [Methylophaga sp.]
MTSDSLEKIARAFTEGVAFCDIDGQILHINAIGKRILSTYLSINSCTNLSVVSLQPELTFSETIGRHIRSSQMIPLPKFIFDIRLKDCHFEGMRISSSDDNQPFILLIKFWDQTIRHNRFAAMTISRLKSQQNLQRYLEAIKQNERNMRLALTSTAESIWWLDVNANIMENDLIWQRVFGSDGKARPVSIECFLSRVHPEDAPVLQRAINRLINHDMVLDLQYRIFDHDNNQCWFYIRGQAINRDDSGKALTVYGLHSDITSTKLIEQRLSDTDTSLNTLLASMPDGVFIASDEKFVFANQAMLSILGYALENFTNLPFSKIVEPEILSTWQKRYRARVAGKTNVPSRYEARLIKSNGDKIWVALIATRIDYQGKSSVMGIIHDITQQKATENLIWHQANYDALTALANRQYFETLLHQNIISAQRQGNTFALVLIDLDNFKDINDTRGHSSGDQILLQMAQRLSQMVGDKGLVARFGGDEFVILIYDASHLPAINEILYGLLATINKPASISGSQFSLTASMGISLFPTDTRSPSVLLRNADQAMYVAKKAGRDRFAFFTQAMDIAAQNKSALIHDLKAAIETTQWLLMYQPIVDLQQHQVSKAEALIRWQHPTRGMVAPDDFIPLAEETGLILQIGQWVIGEAIKTAKMLRQNISPDFQVSINQSSKQFQQHDDRIHELTDIIEQHHIDADMIAIEITEGTLFDAGKTAMQKLVKLRDMGVEVALDDFGTGYSSLSYLKKLDIDFLKIDKSFVWQLEKDNDDHVLIETIILMAHKLGLKVVAEGIETREQLTILVRAGCDFGQGYLFSKPLPPDDLQVYIREFIWPLPYDLSRDRYNFKKVD